MLLFSLQNWSFRMDWQHIVARFNNDTLTPEEWKHDTHIATCIWHLLEYGSVAAALCYLKPRLIGTNIRFGFENSAVKGYHETVTVFWAHELWKFILEQDTRDFQELVSRATRRGSKFMDRHFICRSYQEDPWDSVAMRAFYHPPNITT